jgi:hypothetical protein
MHTRAKRLLDCLQFRFHAFAIRTPQNDEAPPTAGPTLMREPQKREALRLSLAPRLPVGLRPPAELDQPRFLGMQFQPKLRQPLFEKIRALPNISDLGHRPVLLSMIAQTLPRQSQQEDLNLATLYQHYSDELLLIASRRYPLTIANTSWRNWLGKCRTRIVWLS